MEAPLLQNRELLLSKPMDFGQKMQFGYV